MFGVLQLAFKNITIQKKRSLITIVGIALPIMLIVIVGQTFVSMKDTQLNRVEESTGAYHFYVDNMMLPQGRTLADSLAKDKQMGKAGVATELGECQLKDGRFISCIGADKEALELKSIKLKTGKFPGNDYEACIEDWIIQLMDNKPKLGEKFELEIKDSFGQNIKSTFILCGTLNDSPFKNSSNGAGALLCVTNETVVNILKSNIQTQIYGKFINGRTLSQFNNAMNQIRKDFLSEPGSKMAIHTNDKYMTELMNYEKNKGMQKLLMFVILVAAALMIYNAFSISIAERMHQYGQLRCLGMSKVQLFMNVVIEALLLGIVSIFIGLLLGYEMTGRIVRYLILGFSSSQIIVQAEPGIAILSIILGVLTVIVSSSLPAYRAANMSPVEASRISAEIFESKSRISAKEKMIEKHLTACFNLAVSNIKQYKSKKVVTLLSLVISTTIFMLVLFFYFNYMGNSNKIDNTFIGDFSLTVNSAAENRYTDEDLQYLKQIDGVKAVYGYNQIQNYILSFKIKGIDKLENLSELNSCMQSIKYMYPQITNNDSDLLEGKINIPVIVVGLDSFFLEKASNSIKSGVINSEDMRTGKTALINSIPFRAEGIVYTPAQYISPGQAARLIPQDKRFPEHALSFELSGSCTNFVNSDAKSGYALIYLHKEVFDKLVAASGYSNLFIEAETNADYKVIEKELKRMASEKIGGSYESYAVQRKEMRDSLYKYSLVVFSMIIMVVIVSITNIFNTLYSNILLRTNELGMLRAIGMSKKEMAKMFFFESLYYSLFSSLISIILAIALCLLIFNRDPSQNTMKILGTIPWVGYLLTVSGNVLLCAGVMKFVSKRVYKMSTIETIRVVE